MTPRPHGPATRRARSRAPRRVLLAAVLGHALALPVLAQEAGTDAAGAPADDRRTLRLNGFGTVAAVHVESPDDWGFRRELTQPARTDRPVRFDPDSRLGLQADWQPDAQWEFVGQVVLKPRPPEELNSSSITEAFVAWKPVSDWTLRAGRTQPDLFLLADARNVGYAYTWMRPSVDFYGWMPARFIDGADVTHQWTWGESRWRAKLFGGRSTVDFADANDHPDQAHIELFAGGTLTLDDGPWTFKATYAHANSRPYGYDDIQRERDGLDQIASLPIPGLAEQAAALRDSFPTGLLKTDYFALGGTWDADPWTLQAEIARIDGNFNSSKAWYGYLSAARRLGPSTTVFAMAGRARSSQGPLPDPDWTATLAPVIGPVLAGQVQYAAAAVASSNNLGRIDQHSLSVGMRVDLGTQAAVKAQLDDVHDTAYGGGLWAGNDGSSHHALVYSLGLDFVF